jgi:hypothetical protein
MNASRLKDVFGCRILMEASLLDPTFDLGVLENTIELFQECIIYFHSLTLYVVFLIRIRIETNADPQHIFPFLMAKTGFGYFRYSCPNMPLQKFEVEEINFAGTLSTTTSSSRVS